VWGVGAGTGDPRVPPHPTPRRFPVRDQLAAIVLAGELFQALAHRGLFEQARGESRSVVGMAPRKRGASGSAFAARLEKDAAENLDRARIFEVGPLVAAHREALRAD